MLERLADEGDTLEVVGKLNAMARNPMREAVVPTELVGAPTESPEARPRTEA